MALQVDPEADLAASLQRVADGEATMSTAVGPPVGCLMATLGTSLIADVIFDLEDPEALAGHSPQQRIELWGLQVCKVSGCGVV